MKGKKLMNAIRLINIGTSLILIILSVLSFIFIFLSAITSLKLFLAFSPIFMIGFGVCSLGAEFKVQFILKKLPFLKTLIGRALFNIYLSSVIYYYFDASDNTFLAWTGALSLFLSGMLYLGLHFGLGKQFEKFSGRPKGSDQTTIDDKFREPLM